MARDPQAKLTGPDLKRTHAETRMVRPRWVSGECADGRECS